jgi:hypothetical protein
MWKGRKCRNEEIKFANDSLGVCSSFTKQIKYLPVKISRTGHLYNLPLSYFKNGTSSLLAIKVFQKKKT